MTDIARTIIQKVEGLNTYRRGDRRAPHKPLLLLIALSELFEGRRSLSFSDVETRLLPLLKSYAPPVRARHQPELPYWHLQNDELWSVLGAGQLPKQKGGFPTMLALRQTSAGFPDDIADALLAEKSLVARIIDVLLYEHFPPSVHDDILAQVGLADFGEAVDAEPPLDFRIVRRRNPAFRKQVLRAYEYRCAVTGFRAALGGSYFGCEAAHVKWHAYDGPDIVANGISVEPTLHKLFDAGAWTLTDDRRILVSKNYTGSTSAIQRLRDHHGRSLRSPIQGEAQVSPEFIRWHRESKQGGVFRGPALPL